MNFPNSIRWRLQLWHGLLLAAVLSGFGITAYRLERDRVFQRVDEELRRRLPILVASQRPVRGDRELREFSLRPRDAGLFDDPGSGGIYYVVWLRHSERPFNPSVTAPADVPQPLPGEIPTRHRGSYREVFLFPGPGDCVLAGRSIASEEVALTLLLWRLVAVGLGVLALGIAGGAWLTARALRPIQDISSAAADIAIGNLSQRIDARNAGTELLELASVLNAAFDRVQISFQQQTRFTSDAAHELRTPLSVLLTHTQNGLDATCDCAEHRDAFLAARRAAQRMRRLTESLLDLARLDGAQVLSRKESVDLSEIARETMALLEPVADEHDITLHVQLRPALVQGDADQLGQAVLNLITNAIVHNTPGGAATVECGVERGEVVLRVVDGGPGIAPEDLPRIFERFYRADKSRTRSGAGLGLAIAQAVVTLHGGTLQARSVPGQGAAFTVVLPCQMATPPDRGE